MEDNTFNNQFREQRKKEMENFKSTTEQYLKNINSKLNKNKQEDKNKGE